MKKKVTSSNKQRMQQMRYLYKGTLCSIKSQLHARQSHTAPLERDTILIILCSVELLLQIYDDNTKRLIDETVNK